MGVFDGNNNPQRSSFFGRLIIGLIIAAVGWFMFANRTEENPVTGEKQHVAISPNQEIKLGLESAPAMSREMGGELTADDSRTQEVKKLGEYIVDNTDAKKSPWQFEFHVLADDKTINAFALPGGQIFITLGLLTKLQTEAQLAGVLSHEMGHVIERHTAQQMAKNQLGQLLVFAVATSTSDPNQYSGGQNSALIASVVNQIMQLRYSRQDESQADQWGLKLMTKSGYDPYAMIQVMEILKAASGGEGDTPEIFQTHPDPDLRIKQIKEYLEKNPPLPGLSEGKKLNTIFQEKSSSQLPPALFNSY
jgi:predicted Zn-dependent protease